MSNDKNILTWPERIWLQHGDEGDPIPPFTDEATWCHDHINDSDIEYVRADLTPKWIPVSERLPKNSLGYVLIATTKEGREDKMSNLGSALIDTANTVYVRHNAKKGWFTDWQPLPEPPKG